ncbi:unnamed protein product [Paramecium sonneborni]|uniref:Uncharacterized protein n=1 Tax=Paramecium sonneborni TaxID=65129 RepID=A0A8S1MBZ8_9CILI|nr:unnamed protein product [Paramecium sonneborni]
MQVRQLDDEVIQVKQVLKHANQLQLASKKYPSEHKLHTSTDEHQRQGGTHAEIKQNNLHQQIIFPSIQQPTLQSIHQVSDEHVKQGQTQPKINQIISYLNKCQMKINNNWYQYKYYNMYQFHKLNMVKYILKLEQIINISNFVKMNHDNKYYQHRYYKQ